MNDTTRDSFVELFKSFVQPFVGAFAVDTWSTKDRFEVKADLPGVARDKIKIEQQGHWLTISAERECESRPDDSIYFLERPCGLLQRHIRIPRVKEQSATTSLKDGVLTVTMEKKKGKDKDKVKIIPV